MDMPSVPTIQFLVNYVSLCWHRQRRLPASGVWWLWLLTILIHLWFSVSLLRVAPATTSAYTELALCTHGPADLSEIRRAKRLCLVGSVGLMLILRPSEPSPFPWSRRWRVRLVVRRRRVRDMSLEDLLTLLPAGIRTIAQWVDWLTRSQMVKLLAAIPILYPFWPNWTWRSSVDSTAPPSGRQHRDHHRHLVPQPADSSQTPVGHCGLGGQDGVHRGIDRRTGQQVERRPPGPRPGCHLPAPERSGPRLPVAP